MKLPKARTTDIIVHEAGKELLVYNLATHKVYNLNETSKVVFESCNGYTDFDVLVKKHQFTEDLIYLTLDELNRLNLLEAEYNSRFAGIQRREMIKKVGLATMIALPLIVGITAPTPALSQSASPVCAKQGEACSDSVRCCIGFCGNGFCRCVNSGSNYATCIPNCPDFCSDPRPLRMCCDPNATPTSDGSRCFCG